MKLNGRKKDTVEQNNTEIILSDQELRKLQLDLLEMLIEVDPYLPEISDCIFAGRRKPAWGSASWRIYSMG